MQLVTMAVTEVCLSQSTAWLILKILVYDIFGRNTWQADFNTLPPGIHQKPPKQPVESYRKSVSKIFKRKFYFLVVFHVKSVYAQEICFFEAFLRHFHFSTIIDNFSTFWCWYLQPRKHFQKVENLRVPLKPEFCLHGGRFFRLLSADVLLHQATELKF